MRISGDHPWDGGSTDEIYHEGTVNNIRDFHRSVIEGKPLYDTLEVSITSSLSAILGRMAAFTGRTVTWDEMMKSTEVFDPGLELPSDGPLWHP